MEAQRGPRGDLVQLLGDLGACLAAWSRAQAASAPAQDPHVVALRNATLGLRGQLGGLGFGGITAHLDALLRRVDHEGRVADVSPILVALADLSAQAQSTLTAEERARLPGHHPGLVAPGGSAPAPRLPSVQPRRRPGPTMLMDHGSPLSAKPPPLLDFQEQAAAPPPPLSGFQSGSPGLAPPGNVAPGRGQLGGVQDPTRGPQAGAGVPAAPQGMSGLPAENGGRFEVAAPPPDQFMPRGGAPREQTAGRPAPNLQVRTMLGLRAFGTRKSRTSSEPGPPAPAGKGEHSVSLLNLPRRAQPSGAAEAQPPPLLDRPLAGLPALTSSESPGEPEGNMSGGAGARRGRASSIHMLADLVRPRVDRRSSGGPTPGLVRSGPTPALVRNRQQDVNGWRVGAIAIAVLLLVLGGLATLVVVLTRRPPGAEASGSARSGAQAQVGSAAPGELPQSRLLTEDEALRTLLTQVHGRGKESAELRALVDEEAALIASSASGEECKGPKGTCQALARMHSSILDTSTARRVSTRRASGSPDRVRSRWLVGLKLPEIPVEDDPRVQRSLEFYVENPVGRETFQTMLFRCGAYRDLIQSTLVRYGLPIDLWAIVFVESGCSPHATSPVGAAGLWQFMPGTARAYHLRVEEDVIDERRSPPKSTEAAVRYLRDLRQKLVVYDEAGVWDLMFGAYNMGPFGMAARIERAGGSGIGFWDLVDADLLPDETTMYAPAIQAVALILNNLQRLKFSAVQMRSPQLTSDLEVPPGTRLSLVARAAGTSVRNLRALNLDVTGETTPDIPNFAIQVPKDVVWQARDTLKELLASRDQLDKCVPPTFDWGRERFTKTMEETCRRRLGAKPNGR